MSRGFLMFAHNNPQVDYGLIALCNALMIRHNTTDDTGICLITDQGTYDYLVAQRGRELVDFAFTDVRLHAPADDTAQKRRYRDTQYANFELPWHNTTRASAYDHSPFEETVLIDTDYLICDRVLENVWGSHSPIRINCQAITPLHHSVGMNETRLEPFGIKLAWATCVYFRKSLEAKLLFDTVDVVREKYTYYQSLYRFPGKTFRNDYAFSIALHILNGWADDAVEPLPSPVIMTSFDSDDLIDMPARNELLLITEDPNEHWLYRPTRIANVSTHVMNKFAIIRLAERIIDLYRGDH